MATVGPGGSAYADVDTAVASLPYEQNWTDTGQITANNDWSGVAGMQGYRGDGLTGATGVDPQTVLADGSATPTNVIANADTSTNTGGVVEVEIADPTIAIQGSGTADAPHVVIRLDLTGQSDLSLSYNLRDLDGSGDDATQQVALHYRVGGSGDYTNIPGAFVADATQAGTATLVTPVSVELPDATNNEPVVYLRIMTTNAGGNDELVGIDDIVVGDAGELPLTAADPGDRTVFADLPIDPIMLTASNGTPPYSFTAAPLPDGLELVGDTISGTPTAPGTTTVTVEVTDSAEPVASDQVEFDITVVPQACPAAIDPISTVQGAGGTSPCVGETATIEGIVVGDYEGVCEGDGVDETCNLRGFYVQSRDADADGNPATSEGVFVFHGDEDEVSVGDEVSVTGTVAEFNGQTQLQFPSDLDVLSSGHTVAPVDLTLPMASPDEFEQYEGMLVTFDQTLVVTETFHMSRSGEVRVSSGERLVQPTAVVEPGPDAVALEEENRLDYLIIDDAENTQNPDPYVYAAGGGTLSAENTLRAGDTVTDATGVMTYTWAGYTASGNDDAYRLRPQSPGQAHIDQISFVEANPRPTAPPEVGGSLEVVGFNVLNYFLTLDDGGDDCGVLADPQECRGAETEDEYERQHAKLIAALLDIDADVYGFAELENTETAPGVDVDVLAPIVASLNDAHGDGVWDYVDTGLMGTDTIRVGLIYRTDKVEVVDYAILDSTTWPAFDDDNNRPSLAVSLSELATSEVMTVVVNHWKSKGSCPGSGENADQGDGAACWNAARVNAAESLIDWLATNPTGLDTPDSDVLIFGDLNSYAKEDPIDVLLEDNGYVDVVQHFQPGDYSYVFDGRWGTLDYAIASPSLFQHVVGAATYHINADEPTVLDYNTNFQTLNNQAVQYAPDQFRTSDHDPAIVGIALGPIPTVTYSGPQPTNAATITFDVEFSKPVTGFDSAATDVTLLGPAGVAATGISGTGTTYTIEVSVPEGADGVITLSIPAGAAVDADDNASAPSAPVLVTVDRVAPTVAVTTADPEIGTGDDATFDVTFSEPVTGFDAADLTIGGTTVTPVISGAGTAYTVTFADVPASGAITLAVNAGAAVDAAGNPSLASGAPVAEVVVSDPTEPPVDPEVIVPVEPARYWDSREGEPTFDGEFDGTGFVAADQIVEIQIAGRGDVPADAIGVVANLTAILPDDAGFATLYPCTATVPKASHVNYLPGDVTANNVVVPLEAGKVCVYTKAGADFALDVNGYVPVDSPLVGITPTRYADTRTDGSAVTFDDVAEATGIVPAEGVLEIPITGRGEIPEGVQAVFVTVTAVGPQGPGYLRLYPCGDQPESSTLNYAPGETVPNGALAALSESGSLCVMSKAASHVILDVSGYVPADVEGLVAIAPERYLDTRPGMPLVDGTSTSEPGRLAAEEIIEVPVLERGSVPDTATAVLFNVAVVNPDGPGFVQLFPCGDRPQTSNVNHATGGLMARANNALTLLSPDGTVCVFSKAGADVVLDVAGWVE